MSESRNQKHIQHRLTALWALSETGLGGVMHAFNIPFTGIILGGFAIAVLYLLACYSESPGKTITRATIIVLAIKAAASPHSPFGAYFAVGFQGFSAALLYGTIAHSENLKKMILPLHGVITQLMSATQKVFILTLYYGMAFWESVDALFQKITSNMSELSGFSPSTGLIVVYMLLHVSAGIVVSVLVYRWRKKFDNNAYAHVQFWAQDEAFIPTNKKKKKSKYKPFVFIIAMLLFVYLIQTFVLETPERGAFILLRSAVIIALMYGLILPFFKFISRRWIARKSATMGQAVDEISSLLPRLRPLARSAWKTSTGKPFRIVWFFEYLLFLGLTTSFDDDRTADR